MPISRRIKNRYEIRDVLGQGGMGVVYQAVDTDMGREVALKTIMGTSDSYALDLFRKECAVLAPMSHPNIIEIFDIGEFDDGGEQRPFFVMPLLQGQTLEQLIGHASHNLTVERAVEIVSQTCRGLQAAHERGLVHRDLKPSNIFVLKDDSVKIIDFGIAHMADTHSTRGNKGTLLYMSPEQLNMKPVAASSDIFSLGVVLYETLTQRRPFERPTQSEVIEAILHEIPPLASDFNPGVSTLISRVVHKAMAKEPLHRFSTAREFAEILQKAQRNERIEIFDSARIRSRIDRAQKAFEQEDYEFAGEILSGLESEGHTDPGMVQLRRRIDHAARQKRIRQLLESARTRFEDGEDSLALQKVEEALELERDNVDVLTLKKKIESRGSERQIEGWLSLAHQHLKNRAYSHARQALQNVLQTRPKQTQALRLLADVEREEQEYLRLRNEKERRYQAALEAFENGEVSTALEEMEEVLALDHRAPDATSPERGATYQSFYNRVRSDHDVLSNGHTEARKLLAERNFEKALALCDQVLAKYPRHALFKAIKYDAQAQQRQALSAYIADIDRRVEAEPDLDKRLGILREALAQYPNEPHFERSLRDVQERHELVDSIVTRARLFEERAQFVEALGQWEILRTIYQQYPGLAFEVERLTKRRDQQSRSQAKARWVEQIDSLLVAADYSGCLKVLRQAQTEFPNDHELSEIEKLATQGVERTREAEQLLAQGQQSCACDRWEEGLNLLRKARQLDERNSPVRTALVDSLAEFAHRVIDKDWRAADKLAQEAEELDPGHPVAKSIRVLAEDRKRQEFVDECVTQIRRLQASGDLEGALAHLERGLSSYPQEGRLVQLRDTIQKERSSVSQGQARGRYLEQLKRLSLQTESVADPQTTRLICQRALDIADQYRDDREFIALAQRFRTRLETMATAAAEAAAQRGAQQKAEEERLAREKTEQERRNAEAERATDQKPEPSPIPPVAIGAPAATLTEPYSAEVSGMDTGVDAAPATVAAPPIAVAATEASDPIEEALKRSAPGHALPSPAEEIQGGVTQRLVRHTLGDFVTRHWYWFASAVMIPLVWWGGGSVERSWRIRKAISEGDSYYAKGAYEKALGTYENGLERNPQSSALQEKVNQARNAITALRNSQIDELIKQGDSYCAKGEYEKGIGEYHKGLTLDPQNPILLEKLQRARDDGKTPPPPPADAGAHERQEPDGPGRTLQPRGVEDQQLQRQVGSLISQGNSDYTGGRYDRAIAEYQKALGLDPENSLLLRNILQGKIQRARQNQIGAQMKQGDSYYQDGDYDQAIDQYKRALALDPNNQTLTQKIQHANSAKEWERVHGSPGLDSPAAKPKN